jgi:hypothetical protein
MNPNKIIIFTTRCGFYISHSIQYLLSKNSIESEIVESIDPSLPNLFIILFPHKIKVFPKNYIVYQLEQKDISNWIDQKYLLSIYHSICTLDYSESNIKKFDPTLQKKIKLFRIPFLLYKDIFPNIVSPSYTKNDILFYGHMNNRRRRFLSVIQQKYPVKIVNNVYGHELYKHILESKIVLNIHFYQGAILETCRINECLSCEKIIMSEPPNIIDIKNYEYYKDKIVFFNSIKELFEKIDYYLKDENNENYNTKIKSNYEFIKENELHSMNDITSYIRNTQ